MNWYNSQFMKAHPNVTVQRTSVPYANLITKILQDATAGDMPNLLIIDNPNVPEVAATGQLVAFNGLPGFTTSGYTAGATGECTYQGKQYCYPIGTNTIGLFYNKAMLAAAHLSPPTTWAQLQADAKTLTTSAHYGFAFDATGDEQSTWQLEPFFWSNGASLTKVDSPQFQQALQLWVNMVKDGSASKSVLTWGQDPDLTQQFLHGKAAMMINGPWIFPELNAAGWKYNDQYGIVPIPLNTARRQADHPAGRRDPGHRRGRLVRAAAGRLGMGPGHAAADRHGSTWRPTCTTCRARPRSSSSTCRADRSTPCSRRRPRRHGPARSSTGPTTRRSRQAIWTAIQSAITGTASVNSALQTAQGTVSGVQQQSSS